ncbi:MAG: (deoxy)nucleoside triphosphate pyrophosphohydrolase [Clostridia bacterium]|nr:(deoxy)nucleoside triphosphate pyrophosphohydrolase [Clostridia bacterium]MBR2070924.1 (deoxy)nucleoside triphosphate pyrophosphohydrolase [Clostridia bacterium]MBR2160002.1 (deoxy)nucleoside triphosphate pyrophosphohydrolase [Clostridia bacterium]MBR2397883.1 (deoxy)nucleoside triphosphate pyrophosphohydrolase [Clostridia bacterium]MBR2495903.1 (deoxy)nucleoside triphosphate pyrophosphohydrolase [Clostridia bacterium]
MSEIKIVVAGLIFDKDKFLVARRPITKSRGGLFEFVGGKVEEGETHAEALRREFMEELNLEIKVGELFMKVRHTYTDIDIYLYLYMAEIVGGELKLMEHSEIKWITKDEIDDLEFCPADKDILAKIKSV